MSPIDLPSAVTTTVGGRGANLSLATAVVPLISRNPYLTGDEVMIALMRRHYLAILSSTTVIGLFAMGLGVVRSDDAPKAKAATAAIICVSPTNQYVSMVVQNPNGTTQTTASIPWIQNMNVLLAMENANSINPTFSYATQYYCPYGQYVTTINKFYEGGDYYWELLVNGNYAQFGIETQPLNPGDVITWKVQGGSTPAKDKADSHQMRLLLLHRGARLDVVKSREAAK
jgi:Domain of unknown function (DUF4430)